MGGRGRGGGELGGERGCCNSGRVVEQWASSGTARHGSALSTPPSHAATPQGCRCGRGKGVERARWWEGWEDWGQGSLVGGWRAVPPRLQVRLQRRAAGGPTSPDRAGGATAGQPAAWGVKPPTTGAQAALARRPSPPLLLALRLPPHAAAVCVARGQLQPTALTRPPAPAAGKPCPPQGSPAPTAEEGGRQLLLFVVVRRAPPHVPVEELQLLEHEVQEDAALLAILLARHRACGERPGPDLVGDAAQPRKMGGSAVCQEPIQGHESTRGPLVATRTGRQPSQPAHRGAGQTPRSDGARCSAHPSGCQVTGGSDTPPRHLLTPMCATDERGDTGKAERCKHRGEISGSVRTVLPPDL